MASTDARPIPRKNTAFRVTFPLYDADGDLVTAAGSLDSEVSIDGGTFSDCTNEATEIATSSGVYYLDLTAAEMNGDTVAVIVKSAGAKTLPLVFYPEEAGDVRVDVVQISGDATAADNAEAMFDGTGYAGGTTKLGVDVVAISGDSAAADNLESYTDGTTPIPANATQISGDATAADNLEAAADGTGYNLGGGQVVAASVTGAVGSVTGNVGGNVVGSVGSVTGAVGSVTGAVGSVTGNVGGNVTGSVGSIAAGGIAAASFAAGAIDAAAIAASAIGESELAAGAITTSEIATGAIDADALATDAVDEILDDVTEGSTTLRQAIRILMSFAAAKASGGGTSTVTFRDIGDTKDRITMTVNASGDRTAVTLDGS